MAMSKGEKIVKRYNTLHDHYGTARAVWQELADYILTTRKNITTKRTEGSKQTDRLFDSTAPDAATKLAAFIAGSLTNMAIRWFSLKMNAEELNEEKEVQEWLEKCANIYYLHLRQSNFVTESQEFYLDLSTFGLGNLSLEEREAKNGARFGGFLFRAEAIGSYVMAEDAEGLVDTVIRKLDMSVGAAVKKWGEDALSEKARKKFQKNPDEHIDILHAVLPRHTAPGKLKRNKPWGSYYVELEEKKLLNEDGFDENPFFCTRWSKTSGETVGRGPGHIALPDIKTLNKADELTLRGWGKIIEPPLKAREDGVIGRVRTQPSSINIVRDMDALMPMEQGGKWDVNAALTQDRRTSIRRMFFADQLQLPDKTIITATEVERRIELAQQILGPTMGRLEFEYLNPLIARGFKMLERAGLMPPAPPIVNEYAKQHGLVGIDVQYEGPLARAQRGGELQSFNKLMMGCGAVVQIDPTSKIMKKLNTNKTFSFLMKATGAPVDLELSDEDADALMTAEAEAQQAAMQAEQQNVAADTVSKLAGANEQLVASQGAPTSPYGTPQAAEVA
jgi:hypothetical protein